MIRVFDFRMEGSDDFVRLASMSHAMAKAFVEKTRAMLDKDKAEALPAEQWQERRDAVITDAMTRAGLPEAIIREQFDEADIPTLDAMYNFILEKSGLRPTIVSGAGEAKAALTSETSKAA